MVCFFKNISCAVAGYSVYKGCNLLKGKLIENRVYFDQKNSCQKPNIPLVALVQDSELRESEVLRCKKIYNTLMKKMNQNHPEMEVESRPFLSDLQYVPGSFGFWMRGVAILAGHLSKKHNLEGLFVCENLNALVFKLQELISDSKDIRASLIVAAWPSQRPGLFGKKMPQKLLNQQHKMTVCVEKVDKKIFIAVLDPLNETEADFYFTKNTSQKITELYTTILNRILNKSDEYTKHEKNIRNWVENTSIGLTVKTISQIDFQDCKCELFYSVVHRQRSVGCVIFALRDAVAFLQDPDFFKNITNFSDPLDISSRVRIQSFLELPPQFMVGTQSMKLLEK